MEMRTPVGLCTPDFIAHIGDYPEMDLQAFQQYQKKYYAAFSNTSITIEDMIAEDDRVVTRYIFTGTHQADFWGIPPTGKSVEIKGIWIHRLANQCIVEGRDWGLMDIYGMMRQLGVSNE